MKFDPSMFKSIRDGLDNKKAASQGGFSNIMKFKCPSEEGETNVYTVRLLPYIKNPDKTFFEYTTFNWNSHSTGQFQSEVSPSTFGERCFIAEERSRIYRMGSEAEKAKLKTIQRRTQTMVSVYVVNDPIEPSNNGKVMILRYGKQLGTVIDEGIKGEDAAEVGARAFMLGPEGVNLRIRVVKQGEFIGSNGKSTPSPTFVTSKFTGPVDLGLTEEEMDKIYDSAFDLEKVHEVKTYDQLKNIWIEHYGPVSGGIAPTNNTATPHVETTSFSNSSVNESASTPTPAKAASQVKVAPPVEDEEDMFDLDMDEIEKLINE